MRAEEYLREHATSEQVSMNEYRQVVPFNNALIAVNMAREEVLKKIENELSVQDFKNFPDESMIAFRSLIRFIRDGNESSNQR